MPDANQCVFRDPAIVASYAEADYLEPAERTLIEFLQQQLPQFRMLDIAVGAGRSTAYFAPLTSEYVAIDYSPEMIDVCSRRYAEQFPGARFWVMDMRSLEQFADHSFDVIFISYNAISALKHQERLDVFKALSRICSPQGVVYFSAHNVNNLHHLFGLGNLIKRFSLRRLKHSYWDIRKWWLRRLHNPLTAYWRSRRADYAMIKDGAADFRLEMYYVRPSVQVKQLANYFGEVKVFAMNGHPIVDPKILASIDDAWLFYWAAHPVARSEEEVLEPAYRAEEALA